MKAQFLMAAFLVLAGTSAKADDFKMVEGMFNDSKTEPAKLDYFDNIGERGKMACQKVEPGQSAKVTYPMKRVTIPEMDMDILVDGERQPRDG